MGERGPEPILENKSLVVMQSYGMPFVLCNIFVVTCRSNLLRWFFKLVWIKLRKRFDFDMIDNV